MLYLGQILFWKQIKKKERKNSKGWLGAIFDKLSTPKIFTACDKCKDYNKKDLDEYMTWLHEKCLREYYVYYYMFNTT